MPVITMPKLSDTMTEGILVRWLKKKGETVEIGDILAEVETDKATMEMEAFDEGVLEELYVKDGDKVAIGAKIALLKVEGESSESTDEPASSESADEPAEGSETKNSEKQDAKAPKAASAKKEAPAADKTESAPAAAPTGSGRTKASPLAKKIAAERGVDLTGVTGTGPGGRIVAKDVPEKGSAPKAAASAAPAPAKLESTGGDEQRLELTGMRRVIAERLLLSKTTIPHFYLTIEVDAAPLMRLRKEVNAANESADLPKVTVNDFVLLATAHACAQNPKVNAAWGGDHVMQYGSVNISVAVAVDDGLVTPVVRDAQKLSLRQISAAVKELAGKARTKKLKPEDYSGGTITVSNLGAYGIETFSAIINPPQASILAVGAIVKKPVVNAKGEIVVGERMSVTLSCDHRVIDGAVGAEFMGSLRKLIENPALMLF